MKHLFASCAVIALMAAPALAQSTYEPTEPFPDAEVMPEQQAPDEGVDAFDIVTPFEAEPDMSADAETDPVAEPEATADTETDPVAEPEATAEFVTGDEMVAEADPVAETEMVANTEAIDAPIDLAELPEEYSTADLNALMLAQLNDAAVEIAEMEFEADTESFASTEMETGNNTFAETDTSVSTEGDLAMNESADALATEDYASTQTETYAETETYVAPESDLAMTESVTPESPVMEDYAATETLPSDDSTLADNTAVEPEAYASVEPNIQDNVAPPYDSATELSEETGIVVEMAENTSESGLTAEGDIDQTAVEIASQDDRFSTLVELVGIAGLQDTLSAEGPYTVFAPTNEAFAALPETTLAHLKTDAGKAELSEILKSHVAEGTVLAGEVPLAGQQLETLGDASLNVMGSIDGSLNVQGSNTIGEGVSASNGVVYAIDAVILPEAAPETTIEGTEG